MLSFDEKRNWFPMKSMTKKQSCVGRWKQKNRKIAIGK